MAREQSEASSRAAKLRFAHGLRAGFRLTDILTSRLASARDQITLSDSMREKTAEATRATRGKSAEVESAGGKGGQKWPDYEVANRIT